MIDNDLKTRLKLISSFCYIILTFLLISSIIKFW